jgi:hypothetical protein
MLATECQRPNPIEFRSGGVKIGGHRGDFTQCGETEQPRNWSIKVNHKVNQPDGDLVTLSP